MRGPEVNFVWMDETSSFGRIIGTVRNEPLQGENAWVMDSITRSLTDFPSALIRSGRGYGKRHAQWVAMKEYQRNSLAARQQGKIPGVEVEKIRWRCGRPSAPPSAFGPIQDKLERMLMAMDHDGRFARMKVTYEQIYDAQRGETQSAPSVVDNVNVVTDRVPPHIAALPESEQGPALVEAIFERKRREAK